MLALSHRALKVSGEQDPGPEFNLQPAGPSGG